MNKLLSILITAVFSALSFSVVAADATASGVGAAASQPQVAAPAKTYAKKYQESGKSEMKEEKHENKMHEMKETKAQERKEK
ncbi:MULTISPECIES: hypothetical protein [unclassified Pandoraea]|uniref:hypothetical protein n=1 Tax=unclassified Pandoraea TaxID=2624094 RepID=UPI00101B103C|nr:MULTISPECIES: hypothetical protein [unclassified Pandoraea]QBC31829.1 hypothetical protein DRB87_11285 [Pandoraea sp. XY-2]BDD94282.1 hypothetical protein PanNE5_37220 [Pandoraea sp. NE5]